MYLRISRCFSISFLFFFFFFLSSFSFLFVYLLSFSLLSCFLSLFILSLSFSLLSNLPRMNLAKKQPSYAYSGQFHKSVDIPQIASFSCSLQEIHQKSLSSLPNFEEIELNMSGYALGFFSFFATFSFVFLISSLPFYPSYSFLPFLFPTLSFPFLISFFSFLFHIPFSFFSLSRIRFLFFFSLKEMQIQLFFIILLIQ